MQFFKNIIYEIWEKRFKYRIHFILLSEQIKMRWDSAKKIIVCWACCQHLLRLQPEIRPHTSCSSTSPELMPRYWLWIAWTVVRPDQPSVGDAADWTVRTGSACHTDDVMAMKARGSESVIPDVTRTALISAWREVQAATSHRVASGVPARRIYQTPNEESISIS